MLQYYGYRERLKHFGREHEVEDLNRAALRIAREVAEETGKIMAGSVSNTPLFRENDETMANKITDMFRVRRFFFFFFFKKEKQF